MDIVYIDCDQTLLFTSSKDNDHMWAKELMRPYVNRVDFIEGSNGKSKINWFLMEKVYNLYPSAEKVLLTAGGIEDLETKEQPIYRILECAGLLRQFNDIIICDKNFNKADYLKNISYKKKILLIDDSLEIRNKCLFLDIKAIHPTQFVSGAVDLWKNIA
jgi:hypothetical protein